MPRRSAESRTASTAVISAPTKQSRPSFSADVPARPRRPPEKSEAIHMKWTTKGALATIELDKVSNPPDLGTLGPSDPGTLGPWVPRTFGPSLHPQQLLRIPSKNLRLVLVADGESTNRVEHQRNAADHVRIVARGENPIHSGEFDRKRDRSLREVDGVVVEMPLEVRRGRFVDVGAALFERAESPIEPLGQIGNRAPEVAEHPLN